MGTSEKRMVEVLQVAARHDGLEPVKWLALGRGLVVSAKSLSGSNYLHTFIWG